MKVARQGMGTRFEIVLPGTDAVRLRAAAEEALGEVERLEEMLSPFLETSEVARLNRRAAIEPVRVSPELFRYLEQAADLSRISGGAFDLTVGPLMAAWGFRNGSEGDAPPTAVLADAQGQVGMRWVELDHSDRTVRFHRPGLRLDLGAFGKGLAIDRAVERLREAGVGSALLHGGTSSAFALGEAPDGRAWRIGLEAPASGSDAAMRALEVFSLRDESLSVSAIWGRVLSGPTGKSYGHVIDPRDGHPVNHTQLAAVMLPSAAESDALSTALLVLGAEGVPLLSAVRPGLRTLVLAR